MTARPASDDPEILQALYDKLREVAREPGRTISYWEIAPIADVDRSHEHFAALVGRTLDEVNRVEHAAGRPLLSAVVIGKESGMPGSGFFTCARDLGRYTGRDDLAFWVDELRRVNDFWSRHRASLTPPESPALVQRRAGVILSERDGGISLLSDGFTRDRNPNF